MVQATKCWFLFKSSWPSWFQATLGHSSGNQFEAKEEKKDPAVCIQCDDLASSSSVSKYKMIARSSDHELNTLLCRKQCFTASLFFPDHSSGLVNKFSRVIWWRLSFLDCQRGSLRLTQMMSLDVKMLEKKLFTVWSQTYELRKEPFWGWYKKLPPYTILPSIYSASPPSVHLWINRR